MRLQHSLPTPDTHEITQYSNTIHDLRTLAQRNSEHELLELSYLLEIRHALQFNISSVNIDNLLTSAADISATNPLRQNHLQLSLLRLLLHIMHLVKLGNGSAAAAKLREHHQFMDQRFANELELWQSDGKFDVLVCNGQRKIYVEWFTPVESVVFGYLLSGVANIPDSSGLKAWNFLLEGVRVVDSTFPQLFFTT
jgi:Cohesin loading factor